MISGYQKVNTTSECKSKVFFNSKTNSASVFFSRKSCCSKNLRKASTFSSPTQNYLPSISRNLSLVNKPTVKMRRPRLTMRIQRLRKINRLLDTINNISLLYNETNDYDDYFSNIKKKTLKNRKGSLKENSTKEDLIKLVNNDSSYLVDISLLKKKLMLGRMRNILLCSKN